MTCEDADERNRESMVDKAARLTSSLLASGPIRQLARLLPQDMRRALASVFLTMADVLRT